MIIKHWMDCPVVATHGRLREWQIFTKRQGHTPNAETGAVCYDYSCYGRAALLPGVMTEPAAHEGEIESFFVSRGEGEVQVGKEKKSLREGSMIFIPAGAEHRLKNTGAEEMELIFSRRAPSTREAGAPFNVRHWSEDRDRDQWPSQFQGHWYHMWRGPTCGDIHIGDIPPRKFAHPHNHTDILDEIWYVRSGRGWHWMGQEYHEHTAGYAIWLDPTALHSLMNTGDTTLEYVYNASWELVRDRDEAAAASSREAPMDDPAELLDRLEKQFKDLVDGYRRTGVSIHGVDRNIGGIQAKIQALRGKLGG